MKYGNIKKEDLDKSNTEFVSNIYSLIIKHKVITMNLVKIIIKIAFINLQKKSQCVIMHINGYQRQHINNIK